MSIRPTPSLVVATFALIVASSTGGYAAAQLVPKNSVVSKSIKNGQVKAADLGKDAVSGGQVKDGSLTLADLTKGTVAAGLADGSLTGAKIADGSLGAADLNAGLRGELDDASTLGGMTTAQIIAASGGEYVEARQAVGTSVNILKKNSEAVNVVTLTLPHAGKWLVTGQMSIECTWSPQTGDPDDAQSGLDAPYFYSDTALWDGATKLANDEQSCQAEAVRGSFETMGSATGLVSRLVTTTGPKTLVLKGGGARSVSIFGEYVPSSETTAIGKNASLIAVSVQ